MMAKENVDTIVKNIKQSFRLYMNGVTAESIRKKGFEYKISWGISLQHLQEIAKEYSKSYEIANALWKSEVRECKILALMMFPPEEMKMEDVEYLMKGIRTLELVEFLVINILQYLSYAKEIAFRWITNENKLYRICAYNLIGRLLSNSQKLNKQEIDFYLKQSNGELTRDDLLVKHSVVNSLIRFAEKESDYDVLIEDILKKYSY